MIKRLLLTFFFTLSLPLFINAQTALEIMTESDNLPSPSTARAKIAMSIEKGGEVELKGIMLTAADNGENEKILLKITEIPSGEETKILTHTKKNDDDLQWLKMPNGRVKRITTADRSGTFVNSHLFYEDLRSRNINDYEYRLIGEEKTESYDCYKIEAVPKPGKSIYDKAEFFVIKSGSFRYFIVRADIYFDGYLYKRIVNYDLKKEKNYITPYKSVIYRININGNILGNTKLEIKALEYDSKSINDSVFNQGRL
jgi:hypothetical protein